MSSISLEATVTCAVERAFGVRTGSIVVTIMRIKSALIDVSTASSIALITWITCAVEGSNLVGTECILVTIVGVHLALVYVYGNEMLTQFYL